MNHTIITMIGSMQFYNIMLEEETRLTDLGYIVLHPVKSGYDNIPETLMQQYDSEIRQKIDLASIVYVIDVDGYIGKSTKSEIEYASISKKLIVYLSDKISVLSRVTDVLPSGAAIGKRPTVTLIGSGKFAPIFKECYKRLSMYGIVVHTPAIFAFETYEVVGMSQHQHDILDQLHTEKLKMADYILIVDGNIGDKSYVGDDTQKEIATIPSNKVDTITFTTTQDGCTHIIRKCIQKDA